MPIPASNFRRYIEGGRLWPQKRCATSIFLLYSILCDGPTSELCPNLLNTLRSEPSEDQLAQLHNVTTRLHTTAGIPVTVTTAQLRKEWTAIKSYTIRSLILYCSNSNLEVYKQDARFFTSDIFDYLIYDMIDDLSADEQERLKNSVISAFNVIKRERRFSGLYRLTFFSPSAIEALRPAPHFSDLTANLDLYDFVTRNDTYRRLLLIRVGLAIHKAVREAAPSRSTGWLTTGFFAE